MDFPPVRTGGMLLGIEKSQPQLSDWRHADMRLCGSLQIKDYNDCFGRSDVPAMCGRAAILLQHKRAGGIS